ncbi:MAG: zinc-ribbon domain-containing protein [Chloroflexi bacterium]|nr:zinc-ribbon domain-containing protein [Chloroflexota bacterium]
MPAFCSSCGAALADGSRFCASCGTASDGSAQVDDAATVPDYVQPRVRTSIPDFVRQQLHPSEQVLAAFPASLFDHRRKGEFRHDKFVLTTERIVYYHTGVIHKGMGQMPYRGITGASFNKGFRHGTVVVEAANAALTIGGISNDDAAFAERVISAFVGGRPVALALPT